MIRCDWVVALRPGYAFFEAYHKITNIFFSKRKNKQKKHIFKWKVKNMSGKKSQDESH